MLAKNLETNPPMWFCDWFWKASDRPAHIAFWKTLPNWQYYSTWYDLNSAEREYRAGHYEGLRGILDGISKQQDPLSQEQQSELHYWRGYLYWATGKPGLAAAEFKTVLSHESEHPDVELLLGEVLTDDGKPTESIEHLTKFITAPGNSSPADLADAYRYRSLGSLWARGIGSGNC